MKPFIVLVETRCQADSYFIEFDNKDEAIELALRAWNREYTGSGYDVFDVTVIDVEKGKIPFK